MLETAIKRVVKRLWPELTANLHLPQWGRVEAVYAIASSATSTPAEPLYCVDVQMLNAQGKDDSAIPILSKVPLPSGGNGDSRGFFAYPKKGALVELAFILGNPNKPFIRTVLVQGNTMPTLNFDDVLVAKDALNYYRIDTDDNIKEECQAIAERIAKTKQRLVVKNGGVVWVGNEAENLLRLVSDLMTEVINLASSVAAHDHNYSWTDPGGNDTSATPGNKASQTTVASNTTGLKSRLETFKE